MTAMSYIFRSWVSVWSRGSSVGTIWCEIVDNQLRNCLKLPYQAITIDKPGFYDAAMVIWPKKLNINSNFFTAEIIILIHIWVRIKHVIKARKNPQILVCFSFQHTFSSFSARMKLKKHLQWDNSTLFRFCHYSLQMFRNLPCVGVRDFSDQIFARW
jgi:hypothetical protein